MKEMDANAAPAEKAVVAMRRCGHYLHHNFGKGEALDCEAFLSALTKEEQQQLAELLNRCIESWK